MKTGLVLEGGGMRGVYTSGVLDALISRELFVDYVIGVSAGACCGVNFVARQRERLWNSTGARAHDKNYMGVGCLIRTGSFVGMDYIFDRYANELDPFDYDTFISSDTEFVTVITNAEKGECEYVNKAMIPRGDYRLLAASCSLPVFSPPVALNGKHYFDGGVIDPIPVERALIDGCDRVIVVLTQPDGYVKGPQKGAAVYKAVLRKYPKVRDILAIRHETYNRKVEYVRELEKQGAVLVLRPSYDTGVSRMCRDDAVLKEAFELGKRDLDAVADRLGDFTRRR